jgi:NodT family efflux transporter outer membrane factor (OMF) lipoprotein
MKLFLLLLALSGCVNHSPYDSSEIDIPCEWENAPTSLSTESNASFNWWEQLQDPLLNELMTLAADQNLDLQIGAMRVLASRTEANGKKGDLYPHVDATFNCGNIGYNKKALEHIIGTSCAKKSFNFFEAGFDAEWEIDFFGMTAHTICALQAEAEASLENLSDIWVTLSAEIGKNYIELRGLQTKFALHSEKLCIATRELQLTKELMGRGLIDDREIGNLQTGLYALHAEEPLIEFEIAKTTHRLSILLGLPPQDLKECLQTTAALPSLPKQPPIGLPSELLQNRPDIKKAEMKLAAATERTESAIAALFPRFSLWGFIGDISTNAGSLFTGASTTWGIGPQILVPIFNSRLLMQDVEYNQIATQEALYTYQKTVLEALEEAENAIAAYTAEEKRFCYLNESYLTLAESLRGQEELYQRGASDYLSVATLAKDTLTAQELAIQSQRQQLLNYIAIYKAIGGSLLCEELNH